MAIIYYFGLFLVIGLGFCIFVLAFQYIIIPDILAAVNFFKRLFKRLFR